MTYEKIKQDLANNPRTWLVTGVAGFIGSNLLEELLKLNQRVVGLDNFIAGKRENLLDVKNSVSNSQWNNFTMIEGDIRDASVCQKSCEGVDYVLHQAALGSVPKSLENPELFHEVNVTGFLNIMLACRDNKIRRLIYASSSSVYGDNPDLPKTESSVGLPLSPYAMTKSADELYATTFFKAYHLSSIGLRYFNVFGKRQDPDGSYAAVMPKWISTLIKGETVYINGTGEISRDFCYITNVVQANLLAALTTKEEAANRVYNVAAGERTTLLELFQILRTQLKPHFAHIAKAEPAYREYRPGDILHSLANIAEIKKVLGYVPTYSLASGLSEAIVWYIKNAK